MDEKIRSIKFTYSSKMEQPLWILFFRVHAKGSIPNSSDQGIYDSLLGLCRILDSMSFKRRKTTVPGKNIKRVLDMEAMALHIYNMNGSSIIVTITFE